MSGRVGTSCRGISDTEDPINLMLAPLRLDEPSHTSIGTSEDVPGKEV